MSEKNPNWKKKHNKKQANGPPGIVSTKVPKTIMDVLKRMKNTRALRSFCAVGGMSVAESLSSRFSLNSLKKSAKVG